MEHLLETLESLDIPDGTVKDLELGKFKVHFEKNGGEIAISIVSGFDDSEVKEDIDMYKKAIKELDDDTFVNSTEELSNAIDLHRFNDLLDLESFTQSEADEVEEMMNISTEIICKHLQSKITELVDLYDKF